MPPTTTKPRDPVVITPESIVRAGIEPTGEVEAECLHPIVYFPEAATAIVIAPLPGDSVFFSRVTYAEVEGPPGVCSACHAQVEGCRCCGGLLSVAEMTPEILRAHLRAMGHTDERRMRPKLIFRHYAGKLYQCFGCGATFFVGGLRQR